MSDSADDLRSKLLRKEKLVVTSRVSRLWRTGRSAASMATAVLSGRWKGRGQGLEAADLKDVSRLVERLGELKGVAMKAGQILGYVDPSLSPELRALLSVLQTAAPASPFAEVQRTIGEALGTRATSLIEKLERVPIAVASIGQVHHGSLPDGSEVAVKVLHPGVRAALEGDFQNASAGSAIASMVFGAAGSSVQSFIEEARTAILEECDLQLEAAHQIEFARLFEDDPDIVVPPPVPEWCGPGLLTTAWRPAQGLEAWLADTPSVESRDRIGCALFRFYFGTLYKHGLFHADPHPGNYGIQRDGRLVVYDFGCVRRFDARTVVAFSTLVTAVRRDDLEAMADALHALGAARRPVMNAHLRSLLRGFFGPLIIPGRRRIEPDQGLEARRALQDKRAVMRLALPGKLLFLFRLRFGLYSVLSRIGAAADWSQLESGWADASLAKHR